MIVSVRGGNGSGKSHLVRRVMGLYAERKPVFVVGRKKPQCYVLSGPGELCVVGHYETPCGGCDTIKTTDLVYETVRAQTVPVLYEGITVAEDVRRAVELSRVADVRVVYINTPVEECLKAVAARRAERGGDERPFNSKMTRERDRALRKVSDRLQAAGILVYRLDREAAFLKVRELLGV